MGFSGLVFLLFSLLFLFREVAVVFDLELMPFAPSHRQSTRSGHEGAAVQGG